MPKTKARTHVYEPEVPPVRLDWLYAPEEAAPYLRMSLRQVTRRLDAGHLGYTKIGRKRYISGAQIAAYMGEHAVDPRPPHMRPNLRGA